MRVDPALADFARDEVKRQLGRSTRISHVEALQVGGHHAVLLLTVEPSSRRLVLKVAGPGDKRAIDYDRTATITALAQAAGAPVPAILAVDTSYRAGPWRYLLLEHVDGVEWRHVRPLLDGDEVSSAHRQIAAALLAIQSVRFSSFGELNGRGQPAAGDLLSALRRRAAIRIADEHARDSFNRLLDREAALFVMGNQAATLSHDDLHHANLIFHAAQGRWQLAGVLDWDKAWAGPAESDVARMAFWDDMTGPGFWEVYRAAVPMIDGRSERMLIYQLLWCLEYNETSTRHLIETNSLRGQLGIQQTDGGCGCPAERWSACGRTGRGVLRTHEMRANDPEAATHRGKGTSALRRRYRLGHGQSGRAAALQTETTEARLASQKEHGMSAR